MTVHFKLGGALLLACLFLSAFSPEPYADAPRLKLSEYAFFKGKLSDLSPAPGVFPYEVNAPLFSDYAEKARFIYLPEGTRMEFDSARAFGFPTGAAIIKNFYYWKDARAPDNGRNILETRILLKEELGWKAYAYVWNAEQTEATLEVAGAHFPVQWITKEGAKMDLEYIVPNLNQCKGCHSYDGKFVPIGTTVRQLNRTENGADQLLVWQQSGLLTLPSGYDPAQAPRLTDYRKPIAPATPGQNPYESAARAYLDGNCAHCHNPHGPANTSGMFLSASETDAEHIGIGKPPVAAGRGSGDRRFGIVPGQPGESILVYRMESNDPGVRMPELGRQLAHQEGVELIKAWIRKM